MRRTDAGFFSSIEGTLVPLKPSSDLEAGAGWRRPGRALYVAVLDAFNDLIYQDLQALNAAADTALDYERQPVTLRGNVDVRLATRWRVEARAGVLLPATIRAYVHPFPTRGSANGSAAGSAGGTAGSCCTGNHPAPPTPYPQGPGIRDQGLGTFRDPAPGP